MSEAAILSLEEARSLVLDALAACGAAAGTAASVARALVAAGADGQVGHGLSRVPSYAAQLRAGKVDGRAVPSVERVAPAVLRVDAGFGFAFPAFDRVIEDLPSIARETGIALAAIVRSHHFGQAGAHCERLAEQGLVALVFGNTPKAIAPWGGRAPLLGTNPIAFAAPMAVGAPPLVIDLALSRVARGKILAAEKAGKSIPEGWALDKDGNPTGDSRAALAGTMVPIGEAKGAALALMVEVMSAALVGAHFGFEASSFLNADGPPPDVGQTVIAIDAAAVSGGAFAERMATLAAAFAAEPGVRLPGSRRLQARAEAARDGLSVPAPLLAEIKALAGKD